MLINVAKLDESLKKFRISKKNIGIVTEIIQKQLFLYKSLNLDPSKVSLIIVGKKIEGIDTIRVFEKDSVIIEILDSSYTRMKNLSSLESWNTNFILWVSFLEEGNYVEIAKCKISDINNIKYKKVKSLTYGVTDGENTIKLAISLPDVKGADYEILRNAIAHSFYKNTGKNNTQLDCVVIEYS